MGRGRGKKGKKQVVISHDDPGSGDDEKLSVKRRGRPQKSFKDEMEEVVEVEKIEHEAGEAGEDPKRSTLNKSAKNQTAAENGKKRKSPSEVGENEDWVKVENGIETKANATDSIKFVGYRQNGSRRKNKPRRAAEVGVECR